MWRRMVVVAFLVLGLVGCGTVSYRTSPKFETYFDASKTVAVLPPDVWICQLTAGGVEEYMVDWSKQSAGLLSERISKELGSFRDMSVVMFQATPESTEALDQQRGMFYAVSDSIMTHTYLPALTLQHKLKNFDYTLGSELGELTKFIPVDVFVFCSSRNAIWTAGRTALATFGALTALATGVAIIVPAGKEFIAVSLVDALTGEVLWFNYLGMPGDMRNTETVDRIITQLFKDFPKKLRK